MEYRLFAPDAYAGGLAWVATFVALGYFLGEEWHKIVPKSNRIFGWRWAWLSS